MLRKSSRLGKIFGYLILWMFMLALGAGICFFSLEYGISLLPDDVPVAKAKSEKPFPITDVAGKLGINPSATYEPVSWNGHKGYIITGSKGERLFCNYIDGMFVVGDIISVTGENITRKMAEIFNAKTMFDTIAAASLVKKNISQKSMYPAIDTGTPPAANGEATVSRELFNLMDKLPSFDLASKDGPVRMIMFTWESCPSCSSMKNIISKMNLPFRVLEVPTGGNPRVERDALERLNPPEQEKEATLNRIRDAALIVNSLTGKMAVPIYAWQMPDGEIRFGFIPAQNVIDRLDSIAKAGEPPLPKGIGFI